MAFEVFDNRPFRQSVPALTVDKFARIYMNSAARDEFDCHDKPIQLYIGYDSVNRRIGLAKPNIVKLVDTRPMKFDKRSYTAAKSFLETYNIDYSETKRYVYVGKDDVGWYMFELEGYNAPDAKGQEKKVKERKAKV